MTTSSERLANDLEALQDDRLAEMAQKAREGYYNDFHSPLMFPRAALVEALIHLHLFNLVNKALNGEYHATVEEAIEWRKKVSGQDDRSW